MQVFRDYLLACELLDLGFSGVLFTYDNGQQGGRNVRVRLDRAYADDAWRDLFPLTQVTHLATSCSDHCPLIILSNAKSTRAPCEIPVQELLTEISGCLKTVQLVWTS